MAWGKQAWWSNCVGYAGVRWKHNKGWGAQPSGRVPGDQVPHHKAHTKSLGCTYAAHETHDEHPQNRHCSRQKNGPQIHCGTGMGLLHRTWG